MCSLLGTLGAMLGVKLYILGVMGYDKPIWDVLAPEGEQEGAQKRSTTRPRSPGSQLGKWCQLGCSSSDLLRGSLGSVFHRKKCVLE